MDQLFSFIGVIITMLKLVIHITYEDVGKAFRQSSFALDWLEG
jgi:hypothetical protein